MTGVDDVPETIRRPGYYGRFLPDDFVPEPPTLRPVGPCQHCGRYPESPSSHEPSCRLYTATANQGDTHREIAPGMFDGTYDNPGTVYDFTDKRKTPATHGNSSPDG